AKTLLTLIKNVRKVFSYMERLFKPRLAFMLKPPLLNLISCSMVISGLALSLPLPPVILFSNSLPGCAVIFLSIGYLERDGLVILAGHILTVASWCYFAFWWEAVKFAFTRLIT